MPEKSALMLYLLNLVLKPLLKQTTAHTPQRIVLSQQALPFPFWAVLLTYTRVIWYKRGKIREMLIVPGKEK